MARPRKKLDTHGQGPEVLRLLKKTPAGWKRERLLAVKLGLENELGIREIAEQMAQFKAELEKNQWRTGKQAYDWLRETFGVTFHPQRVYVYLKKLEKKRCRRNSRDRNSRDRLSIKLETQGTGYL